MRGCILPASLGLVLLAPGPVQAAAQAAGDIKPLNVPWWSAAPFVLLLLCIAVLPLLVEHWWHRNRNKALVAIFFGGLAAAYLLGTFGEDGLHAVEHAVLQEYFPFIVLLGSLYTISGGIVIEGDLRGRPVQNTLLLLIGTCLASFIGTTGASMLLIRPFLRMNHGRRFVKHLPMAGRSSFSSSSGRSSTGSS
jgi:Na+/H+ antiporter NhaD/arsenite permease-like protein